MSYIRCTGNPDRAYVWHDIDGTVHFTVSGNKGQQVCFNATIEKPFKVPHRIFLGLIRNIINGKPHSYGGFTVEKSIKTGKVTLSYHGQYIRMWEVTWMFIVNQAEKEINRRKKRC